MSQYVDNKHNTTWKVLCTVYMLCFNFFLGLNFIFLCLKLIIILSEYFFLFSFTFSQSSRIQALGFQIPWITIFWFQGQRSWETISNNFFLFRENSWEPTCISFNVQKQFSENMLLNILLNLKNISVYYYLQKTSY